MVTGTMFADEEDITPKAYIYNDWTTSTFTFDGFYDTANPSAPIWTTVDGDNLYNNGLVIAVGGQMTTAYQDIVASAVSIVDLGGTVGKVFAISGAQSNINTALYNLYGVEMDIPLASSGMNWFNIDWFSDPNNTPTGDTNVIHVRLTMNMYSNTFSTATPIDKCYPMDNQNNVQPSGSNTAENVSVSTVTFCKWWDEGTDDCVEGDYEEDDDGGYIWNPERWLVYEFDCTMPASDDDGTAYIPFRIKTEMLADPLLTSTLFVKDVEITYESGGTLNYTTTRNRTWEYYTLSPAASGITSVTSDGTQNLYRVNGNEVSFTDGAQIYTTSGALVGTAAAGESTTLGKGFYVANVGGKGVKFVVK